mgnify:CR=1 FL=1
MPDGSDKPDAPRRRSIACKALAVVLVGIGVVLAVWAHRALFPDSPGGPARPRGGKLDVLARAGQTQPASRPGLLSGGPSLAGVTTAPNGGVANPLPDARRLYAFGTPSGGRVSKYVWAGPADGAEARLREALADSGYRFLDRSQRSAWRVLVFQKGPHRVVIRLSRPDGGGDTTVVVNEMTHTAR